MLGKNFYNLKHFTVTMAVVLLWLRKGCSCHNFLAENKVHWSVFVCVRKGGVYTPCLNYKNQGHRNYLFCSKRADSKILFLHALEMFSCFKL